MYVYTIPMVHKPRFTSRVGKTLGAPPWRCVRKTDLGEIFEESDRSEGFFFGPNLEKLMDILPWFVSEALLKNMITQFYVINLNHRFLDQTHSQIIYYVKTVFIPIVMHCFLFLMSISSSKLESIANNKHHGNIILAYLGYSTLQTRFDGRPPVVLWHTVVPLIVYPEMS